MNAALRTVDAGRAGVEEGLVLKEVQVPPGQFVGVIGLAGNPHKADRERHRHAENPDGCPNARPLDRRCNGRPSMAAAAPRLPETVPSRSCARHHNADTEESRSNSVK